jgi:hypothetical protein
MSQTETTEEIGRTDPNRQFAERFETELSIISAFLDEIEQEQIEQLSDRELVEIRSQLKNLEDTVEQVRKEQADAELESRVEPGESLLGLNRIQSHSKYVQEDASTIIMRAVGQGINYTEFVDINASKLAEVAPDIAEIGRSEYTYFR